MKHSEAFKSNKRKGYVTVFISLILVVMIVVVLVVLEVCDRNHARTKMSTALSSAMSSELADYNRYVFDRYHILMLDSTVRGGVGGMEQAISNTLKTDLGIGYEIEDIVITKKKTILEDKCSEFKRQIKENYKYDLAENVAEKIMDKTKGEDTPVDEKTVQNIDSDINKRQGEINEKSDEEDDSDDADENEDEVTDPRETLKTYTDAGIHLILLPKEAELTTNELNKYELPSGGIETSNSMEVDTSFSDKDRLELDGLKSGGWSSGFIDKAGSLSYAASYFNLLTDKKFDDTVLNLEMEYLVAGKTTDGANYKTVVNEILLIRFGFNFAYIVTDAVKMGECEALAVALTVEFPVLEPVVKYLLAGCWSYIESVADVYRLLRNHKVPYLKNETNWVTDFESLAHLDELCSDENESEEGVGYKDYLLILAFLQGDKLELRMLDLIQTNTKKNSDPSFQINRCITAYAVDAQIDYKGRRYSYHEETGY